MRNFFLQLDKKCLLISNNFGTELYKNIMHIPLSRCNKIILSLGIALVGAGIICITCIPSIVDFMIDLQLELHDGGIAFIEWQKTRPIPMDIFFFNWTNPEDIYNASIKPRFEEVGPYRFKYVREKVNITWNPENNTITYLNKFLYYYDENASENLSDIITTFNMVPWGIPYQTRDANLFIKHAAKIALLFSELHVTKTVRELMFEGYDDPLVSAGSTLSLLRDGLPDRVGLFYGRNQSVGIDGVYNVHIKLDHEYGRLKYWNYNNRTNFFEGSCADVYGSAGEFYPKFPEKNYITYFVTEVCRGLNFRYEGIHTVKGITTYKYTASEDAFDNGTVVKENSCYCRGECVPSGVIDMSTCTMDLPIYTSLPHFYNGDPSYVDAVEGLKPEKDKHEFFLALEPTLGVIADTSARLQLNILIETLPDYPPFDKVPKTMFPIFWTENKVPLYDDYAPDVRLLQMVPHVNKTASMYLMILGSFCLAYVLLFMVCLVQKKPEKQVLEKEAIPLTVTIH